MLWLLGISNVSKLLPPATVDALFFAFVLIDVAPTGASESQAVRRAAAHADGPSSGGGGDERGGGRTLTRFDQGVIDCYRDGALSR